VENSLSRFTQKSASIGKKLSSVENCLLQPARSPSAQPMGINLFSARLVLGNAHKLVTCSDLTNIKEDTSDVIGWNKAHSVVAVIFTIY